MWPNINEGFFLEQTKVALDSKRKTRNICVSVDVPDMVTSFYLRCRARYTAVIISFWRCRSGSISNVFLRKTLAAENDAATWNSTGSGVLLRVMHNYKALDNHVPISSPDFLKKKPSSYRYTCRYRNHPWILVFVSSQAKSNIYGEFVYICGFLFYFKL